MKLAGRIALGLFVLVLTVVLCGLAWRAWRQHQNAVLLSIHDPRGVEEARFVELGGIRQWVTIRGEDRANPVLLFLHGGPGESTALISYLAFRPWEREFTVVQWDQRGAGKTYIANGRGAEPASSIEQIRDDGIALSAYLCEHLKKHRIVLVGHSWGSMLGLEMIHLRPDLFSAYVGTGQVVDNVRGEKIGFAALVARVSAAHDLDSLRALRNTGGPPWRSDQSLFAEREIAQTYAPAAERALIRQFPLVALGAPGYSLRDLYDIDHAGDVTVSKLLPVLLNYRVDRLGLRYKVPVFFFEGAEDIQVPVVLAREYFDRITAPRKAFVSFRGLGHFAVLARPDLFLQALETRVLPIAKENQ